MKREQVKWVKWVKWVRWVKWVKWVTRVKGVKGVILGKVVISVMLVLVAMQANAQTIISGTVTNHRHEPVAGASIAIENSYDGTSSAADGSFSFITTDTGRHKLVITYTGYKTFETVVALNGQRVPVQAILKDQVTELEAVVVSAGSFEASDKKRNTLLKPLDILTTAGQQADIVSALRTLPGAQQVGETEGLFVRGGTGTETKVFIDGMMVTNPFFSSVPGIAQRSRFSPLLFKGTHFSSGGYSSQFGQGLSSALTLETHDLPTRSETNIIASVPQLTLTRLQLNKSRNASIGLTVNYNNLRPYYSLVKQRVHYTKPPEVINGELSGRLKLKNGMLKLYGYANYSMIGFDRPVTGEEKLKDYFKMDNHHVFSLVTYSGSFGEKWKINAGTGFSYNRDNINIHTRSGENEMGYFLPVISNYTTQVRAVVTRQLAGLNKIYAGVEYQNVVDRIHAKDSIPFITRRDNYTALFTETDLYISTKLVARLGMRYEYSSLLKEGRLSPRISLAYKAGKNAQFSAAYGEFYQKPETDLLFRKPGLELSKASHYILNYQRIADGQTIRVELFYKKYNDLPLYPSSSRFAINNDGNGYAKGIELFWRDKKTFKDFSYWIAYSWLDTKRQFLDYPSKVQPAFAANHTVNVVMKQWVQKITSMFSFTYTYASGRPYYNPNLPAEQFMREKTMSYHNTGFQVNYLTMIGKANTVLIFNMNNVIGNNQVYGYRFAPGKDADGIFRSEAITPMARRYFFIGAYLTIGNDRRKEIIDN